MYTMEASAVQFRDVTHAQVLFLTAAHVPTDKLLLIYKRLHMDQQIHSY